MTSEILVMNKEAIALASDSAATLTGEKIFNANKIFRLTQSAPVGIMIYHKSEYLGVPWETVIKEYRRSNGSIIRSNLIDYVDDFEKYLHEFCLKYTDIERNYHKQELQVCSKQIFSFLRDVIRDEVKKISNGNKTITVSDVEGIIKEITLKTLEDITSNTDPLPFSLEDESIFKNTYAPIIYDEIAKILELLPYSNYRDDLTNIAIKYYLTKKLTELSSGIIIAGFGSDELFPSYHNLDFYTRLNGTQHIQKNRDFARGIITHDSPSNVAAFADNSQIMNFMDGIAPDMNQAVIDIFENFLDESNNYLKTVIKSEIIDSIIEKQIQLKNRFLTLFNQKKFYLHSSPIVHIVAQLPKSELAEMAESLVHLSSLRKRVSIESETIGGPIDVAIISKADGFIWIKRKHYFKPELNLHYSAEK